jgi:hypothetical protein
LINETVTLAPKENYTQTLNWSQETQGLSQVTAGAYHILGDIGENTPYQLETAPLAITIY